MNTDKLESLRKMTVKVFPQIEPPDSQQVTTHKGCCEDGDDLSKGFSNVKWWEVGKSVVNDNHGNLPLFKDEAFHYFFPAFLLNALENFTGYNEVLQFLIYALEPKEDTLNVERKCDFETRNQLFSSEQVNLIVSFLELVLDNEDERMQYHHKDAERALNYWKTKQLTFVEQ